MGISFRYSDYYASCCLFPAFICLFNGIGIVYSVFELVAGIVHQSLKFKRILFLIFVLLMFGYLFSVNVGRLCHGGWQLFSEKETDAVIVSGVIVEIKENDRFTFAELGSHYKQYKNTPLNGISVVIDGLLLYAVSPDEFQVGDKVIIKYLPKAKYILEIVSCSPIDENSSSHAIWDGSLINR